MQSINTWKLIAKSLKANIPVMLLFVLDSKGSSPGRAGFCMAVSAAGEICGSIGGGIMEYKFVETAKGQLLANNDERKSIVKKQVHDKSPGNNQSGMICSGEQTVVLYQPGNHDLTSVHELVHCLETNSNGTLHISENGISFENETTVEGKRYTFTADNNWQYAERVGYSNRLFIIGGGHCSLALSKLMRSLDFYISVYEERESLNTFVQNDVAHEKHLISDYSQLNELIAGGDNHYVVIMTVGYRTDDIVLRALLNKDFRYIGLLGSQTKVEKLFATYRMEGMDEERLRRIARPIGLPINSQTPAEIAISIAAEIIKVKNSSLA